MPPYQCPVCGLKNWTGSPCRLGHGPTTDLGTYVSPHLAQPPPPPPPPPGNAVAVHQNPFALVGRTVLCHHATSAQNALTMLRRMLIGNTPFAANHGTFAGVFFALMGANTLSENELNLITAEMNPHLGIDKVSDPIAFEVEIHIVGGPLIFNEVTISAIHAELLFTELIGLPNCNSGLLTGSRAQMILRIARWLRRVDRHFHNFLAELNLTLPQLGISNAALKNICQNRHLGFLEKQMWMEVGKRVCASGSGLGIVHLNPGIYVSRQGYGRFIVVRNDLVPSLVNIRTSAWDIATKISRKGGLLAAEAEDLLFKMSKSDPTSTRKRSASI